MTPSLAEAAGQHVCLLTEVGCDTPAMDAGAIGSRARPDVVRMLLEHADAQGVTVRLNVLQGSAAQRHYERHGFAVEVQGPIDVFTVRAPGTGHREANGPTGQLY